LRGASHVPRLYSRKPPSRNSVHRRNQFASKTAGAAPKWRRLFVREANGVFRLVYVESYERAEEAIAREKQLKRWKRDWKIELIERDNFEWQDLSHLIV
jgi:predicted GIY-YIG superfamily endonuclease